MKVSACFDVASKTPNCQNSTIFGAALLARLGNGKPCYDSKGLQEARCVLNKDASYLKRLNMEAGMNDLQQNDEITHKNVQKVCDDFNSD